MHAIDKLAPEQALTAAVPAPGETSLEARIPASGSALQLDKALLLVKEGKLQGLVQQYLDEQGGPLPASVPLSASSLAISDQPFSRASFIASRRQHLQVESAQKCSVAG